ncbi:MAG: hypothetical protein AAF629_29650 [Chloroflexota bacterium]
MTVNQAHIKKRHIQDTAQFALESIPNIHRKTIELLLELVYAEGTHGTISQERLIIKMRHILRYIPGSCTYSLTVLVDLLEIPLPKTPDILPSSTDEIYMPTPVLERFFQRTSCHDHG